MSTLIELTEEMISIDAAIAAAEGELSHEIIERLEAVEGDLVNKADAYAGLIVEMDLRAKARKAEADRMAALADRDAKGSSFLRERMKNAMKILGLKKLETARFRLLVQGNGGLMPMEVDEAQVPDEWKKAVPTTDNGAIRAHLEEGKTLPFARLKPRGDRLAIK